MINPNKLSPFRRFCVTIGELPSSYIESLSYLEMLQWLCNFLEKKVIPAVNNNAEALEELQEKFITLKKYVDDYFENLDVQEEINNKLDEMAESGQLAEIITLYLQLGAIIGFNTKADLKNGTNFTNGSFAKTFGSSTYNDGLGKFYKIRTKTSDDVIDDNNILALSNYPLLIAELIPDNVIGNLSNLNTNNKSSIVNAINEVNNKKQNLLEELVLFGDSWTDGDIAANVYPEILSNILNLNLNNYAVNGAGFIYPSNNLISTQVTNFINSSVSKEKVKYVIFMGGINDYRHDVTVGQLAPEIKTQVNRIKNICPQAKIIYVSNCQYPYTFEQSIYWQVIHERLSTSAYIVTYNLDGTVGLGLFDNTLFHLSENGQEWLSRNLIAVLTGGEIFKFEDIREFEDSYIKTRVTTVRNSNNIEISFKFKCLQSFTNHTYTLGSNETRIPWVSGTQVLGFVDQDGNPITVALRNKSITVAIDVGATVNRVYEMSITVPIADDVDLNN